MYGQNVYGDINGFGGAGNDRINVNILADAGTYRLLTVSVDGGHGKDFLTANVRKTDNVFVQTEFFGRDGNDTILGTPDGDFISGGNGANMLFGGAGLDTYLLELRTGVDVIELGREDTLFFNASAGGHDLQFRQDAGVVTAWVDNVLEALIYTVESPKDVQGHVDFWLA